MHWFPFYTSDFIGATLELSFDERATYGWMLVIYYETERPLPANKDRLNRLLGAESTEQKERIHRLAKEFFVEMDGRLYNEQCEKTLAKQRAKSVTARERVENRWKKTKPNENNESFDTAVLPQQYDTRARARARNNKVKGTVRPSLTPSVDNSKKTTPKNTHREDAKQILEYLNGITKRNFRAVDETLKPIIARLKAGATMPQCYAVIGDKWEQWGADDRMSEFVRPKTLFSATNFEQYLGAIAQESET